MGSRQRGKDAVRVREEAKSEKREQHRLAAAAAAALATPAPTTTKDKKKGNKKGNERELPRGGGGRGRDDVNLVGMSRGMTRDAHLVGNLAAPNTLFRGGDIAAPASTLRILCLHGSSQNGSILRKKLASLERRLARNRALISVCVWCVVRGACGVGL